MGIIIVDGRSGLQFKGSIGEFESAVIALNRLAAKFDGLKIDTVPLPERSGISVVLNFSGTMPDFEKVLADMTDLHNTVAIDTVPLPETVAIGTWPTPEKPAKGISWNISVSSKGALK